MTKRRHYDDEEGHGAPRPGRTRIAEIIGAKGDREEEARNLAREAVGQPPVEPPIEPVKPEAADLVEAKVLTKIRQVTDVETQTTVEGRRESQRQLLYLRIKLKNGEKIHCPYMHLVEVNQRKEEGQPGKYYLELLYSSRKIVIRGRNLDSLEDQLICHDVADIEEAFSDFDDGGEHDLFISSVEEFAL